MAAGDDDGARTVGTEGSARAALPSDREIVITRVFDAPRAAVFDAWTKPEHVARWWDPGLEPLAICEIDLRPGGAFRFVPRSPSKPAFAGSYREVTPPARLVFSTAPMPGAPGSVGTLRFDEHGGRTTLTITIECASRADRDALLEMRIDVGTSLTLDNLAVYVHQRHSGGSTRA